MLEQQQTHPGATVMAKNSLTGDRKMRHQIAGVTLIELMIVVAIIGILAAIAYPSYRQQVLKSGRVEGKRELMQQAQALEKCFTRLGVYNNAANCQPVAALTGAGVQSEENRYLVTATLAADGASFTLSAAPQGAQAGDTRCGTLTLDSLNIRGRSGTDALNDCW